MLIINITSIKKQYQREGNKLNSYEENNTQHQRNFKTKKNS